MRVWLALLGLLFVGCATSTEPVAQQPDTELLAFDALTSDTAFDEGCHSRHSGLVDGETVCMCATNWDCLSEELCVGIDEETFDFTGACRPKVVAARPS